MSRTHQRSLTALALQVRWQVQLFEPHLQPTTNKVFFFGLLLWYNFCLNLWGWSHWFKELMEKCLEEVKFNFVGFIQVEQSDLSHLACYWCKVRHYWQHTINSNKIPLWPCDLLVFRDKSNVGAVPAKVAIGKPVAGPEKTLLCCLSSFLWLPLIPSAKVWFDSSSVGFWNNRPSETSPFCARFCTRKQTSLRNPMQRLSKIGIFLFAK